MKLIQRIREKLKGLSLQFSCKARVVEEEGERTPLQPKPTLTKPKPLSQRVV